MNELKFMNVVPVCYRLLLPVCCFMLYVTILELDSKFFNVQNFSHLDDQDLKIVRKVVKMMDYIALELEKISQVCRQYGYIASSLYDSIVIRTRFEKWKFKPTENNCSKIKLMHCNMMNDTWHKQFTESISYEDLVLYIHEHEKAMYTPAFVDFTFTKVGQKQIS